MKKILPLILIIFLAGCYKELPNLATNEVDNLADMATGRSPTTTLSSDERGNIGECITKTGEAYGYSCKSSTDCVLKLQFDEEATCEPSLYRKWNINGKRIECSRDRDCYDYAVDNSENNEIKFYLNDYSCLEGNCVSLEQNALKIKSFLS